MRNLWHSRSAIALLWAFASASCGSPAAQKIFTVDELVPRIDEPNRHFVSVAGYLPKCRGYQCVLYRKKGDSDDWSRWLKSDKRSSPPDNPSLGIGSGTNFDFDKKTAPFWGKYVVITGTITNRCRYHGKPSCTDRSTDLQPLAIRTAAAD